MKKINEQHGITLVALVITIIILFFFSRTDAVAESGAIYQQSIVNRRATFRRPRFSGNHPLSR